MMYMYSMTYDNIMLYKTSYLRRYSSRIPTLVVIFFCAVYVGVMYTGIGVIAGWIFRRVQSPVELPDLRSNKREPDN